MQCFVCKNEIAPIKGYFRTQLLGEKLICHLQCQPKFYYDNKPEEKDDKQPELWREQK